MKLQPGGVAEMEEGSQEKESGHDQWGGRRFLRTTEKQGLTLHGELKIPKEGSAEALARKAGVTSHRGVKFGPLVACVCKEGVVA